MEAVHHLSDKRGCSKNVLDDNSIEDPLQNIVHRSKKHPSIIAINRETVPKEVKQICLFFTSYMTRYLDS